jgi:deoxyribodipyrimidine photo-lyase
VGRALAWFRRDLRVTDNPALARAAREHDEVVPVFCFERGLTGGRHSSPARNAYLLACLAELDASLTRLGAPLHYRAGDPARAISELAAECGADAVIACADHTAHARRRDERVAAELADVVRMLWTGGTGCADVESIATASGGPYSVFTPFYRAWKGASRRGAERAPRSLRAPTGLRKGGPPARANLGIDDAAERIAAAAKPGEAGARRRLDSFLRTARRYDDLHDLPAAEGTSRLSPALHFGTISPLAMESRLRRARSKGADAVRRQLCWRDFYLHLLHHHPENARREHQKSFRGMRWRSDAGELEAWKLGRTGYPLVDAGMRQLIEQGWIHNRVRLAVASFLTKDLLIDWREGEAHFMRHLLDGDEANNNGNWQWTASVGADAQPWFRIFNPVRQQKRFDPDGDYVRRWIPELAKLPDRWLAEPWRAPEDVQREAGCVIGRDYPEPLVDHAEARAEALAAFERQASTATSSSS